jgi:hypothetical protein
VRVLSPWLWRCHFQGTVRENLCLVEQEDDATIWAALERAHAADVVRYPLANPNRNPANPMVLDGAGAWGATSTEP